jgi:hypothetical protein
MVLACAAAGMLAVATVRIADATQRHEHEPQLYETTPARAAATLASLHKPSSFRNAKCARQQQSPEWGCWSRTPSLRLSETVMRRLLAEMSVQPEPEPGVPIECSPLRMLQREHVSLRTCQAEGLRGKERVVIFVTSCLLPSGAPTRACPRKWWPSPTEVVIGVSGQIKHEG